MPEASEESLQAAELAVYQRRSLSLDAAAAAGLPGRFESFCIGGLRASMATADQYGFLNTVEGFDDQSVEVLPDALKRFAGSHQPTIVVTWPSQSLTARLLSDGYAPAPIRPIAYLRRGIDIWVDGIVTDRWRIKEASTRKEMQLFLELLGAGYAASSEVEALIRAEHVLPAVRGFIASHNDRPLAAAAMSLHPTGAVLGGASTLSSARGTGAHAALLIHRLRLARSLGIPLATATAAPGASSIRNLAELGFTIVERPAWRLDSASRL
ncbi:hypothetical protein IWX75_002599 [Arthrobacter sp. CAN_A6]|uniref:hypothetical protein n=1 Tax=Arthrobacter sp. CAN_A6 TaxID=2787721 RepID=UPI0018CADC4A